MTEKPRNDAIEIETNDDRAPNKKPANQMEHIIERLEEKSERPTVREFRRAVRRLRNR